MKTSDNNTFLNSISIFNSGINAVLYEIEKRVNRIKTQKEQLQQNRADLINIITNRNLPDLELKTERLLAKKYPDFLCPDTCEVFVCAKRIKVPRWVRLLSIFTGGAAAYRMKKCTRDFNRLKERLRVVIDTFPNKSELEFEAITGINDQLKVLEHDKKDLLNIYEILIGHLAAFSKLNEKMQAGSSKFTVTSAFIEAVNEHSRKFQELRESNSDTEFSTLWIQEIPESFWILLYEHIDTEEIEA